jgi:exopolyphosphatase/guanosine-5'-triphosphate,3'-diphosphate pyrophosphatase
MWVPTPSTWWWWRPTPWATSRCWPGRSTWCGWPRACCAPARSVPKPYFELGDPERELLGYAARLHDVGLSLAEKGHHKHGAYLIEHANLAGFWPAEIETIAQIVRFHRGRPPSAARHETFALLKPWTQHVVEKLAAIVRAADALDRTRRQAVCTVRLRAQGEDLDLEVAGTGDLRPELEGLKDKGGFLFRLLDRQVRVVRIG